MQQQGGSHYGVPPLEMVPQFSSSSGGARQPRIIGIHGGADHIHHHPAAEAVSPIASRSPATFFDELGSGGSGGAGTRSFAEEEALVAAGDEGERGGSVGSRWPRQETLALLKVRSEMDAAFRDATLKGPLWEDVSRKLAELGYKRSAKKCKEKFENVHKYYKRTKEGRAGRQDGKSYRFFSQLEALHSSPATPATADASVPTASSMLAPPLDHRIQPPPAAAAAAISFSSNTSSSSSEDTDDGAAGDGSRKRKRGKNTMAYFEELMKQLMEKQEEMQQRFLETIEKREQDRMVREEAWKRQEMARLNREYELMAQERTMTANRDAAVISFLQKFAAAAAAGVTNPPNPLLEVATVSAPAAHEPSPPPPPQEDRPEPAGSAPAEMDVVSLSSSTSARWPKAEVLALIKLRSGLDMRYLEAGPKGPLWEEISVKMKQLGYNRSTKRCKEKWENINKYFKKVKEGNKKRSEDAKTCPYFHELDALYRRKQQQESVTPLLISSGGAEKEMISYIGEHKNQVTVRNSIGNGGNHEGSGFQMPRSNANGLSQVFFGGGGTNSGSDSALKKPEDIVKELMEQQNHEEEEDDDDDVDDDEFDDDEEEEGKMRYEIQFQQRQSVGAAGGSHGGNAAGKASAPAPPTSNAGSFLAMVQ